MNESLIHIAGLAKRRLLYNLYRIEGNIHRTRFRGIKPPSGGWPILLGISFPKSGTHLLQQILLGFSKIAPFTPHIPLYYTGTDLLWLPNEPKKKAAGIRYRRVKHILNYLNALRPLDVSKGHLQAWPRVIERVCSPDFLPFFIFRDLRDTAVSSVFFLTDMYKRHRWHQYYAKDLATFDDRLMASIQGFDTGRMKQLDIGTRFKQFSAWFDCSHVHKVRYEDLVNDQGRTLSLIIDHFCERVDTLPTGREQILNALLDSINPGKSPTFRSGKTGEWRKYFTDEHKRLFKEVAGDLLIQLGYEQDNDW